MTNELLSYFFREAENLNVVPRALRASVPRRARCGAHRDVHAGGIKAKAILTVLATRGVAVPEGIRARILACSDAATLERWLAKAVTATSAEEVIATPWDHS